MDNPIILSCEDIHKSFVTSPTVGGIQILKGISLSIKEAEIVSIIGPSGSGKSTLLHILGGLDRPSRGEVFWMGNRIDNVSDESLSVRRAASVGFVFQFHHLLGEFSALENVMIAAMIGGTSKSDSRVNARTILDRVGLAERLDFRPSQLSGGEQQRVAIARAIVNSPKIVLADEPTGNLDSVSSDGISHLLRELNEEKRMAFVIVTHNAQLKGLSKRAFQMMDGRLVAE